MFDRDSGAGLLYVGDAGWESPYEMVDGVVPELVMGSAERLWLRACWDESHSMGSSHGQGASLKRQEREENMSTIQIVQVTDRPINNLMLDIVPAMSTLLLRRARSDAQHESTVAIHTTEVQQLIDALTEAQQVLAAGETDPLGQGSGSM